MRQYTIEKSESLRGDVEASISKNSVLPLMAAGLLTEEELHLTQVPRLKDVSAMGELLESLGAQVEFDGAGVRIVCKAGTHLDAPQAQAPRDEKDKMWHLTKAVNKLSCVDFVNNADDKTKEALRTVAWYVDCGDDDFLFECNMNLVLAMLKAGVHYQLRVRDGGHTWDYCHSALYNALPFVSRIFEK